MIIKILSQFQLICPLYDENRIQIGVHCAWRLLQPEVYVKDRREVSVFNTNHGQGINTKNVILKLFIEISILLLLFIFFNFLFSLG